MLSYAATVIPFRVAFVEVDSDEWIIFDYVVDAIFMFDILINFFSAYYDEEENIVTDRKVFFLFSF